MKGLANKRSVVRFLCMLFLAVFMITPTVTEAASITIAQGGTSRCTVSYGGETITVNLSGAYTSVALQGKPNWVSSSKSGSRFTLSVSANSSTSSRSGDIVFRDGSKIWTLKLTQNGKPVQRVTVSFNSNGGYGNVPSQTYTVGSTYGSLPAGPTPPTGRGFDGWYTASSGGSRVGTGTTVSASVTTLYAHYYTKSYTISFNSNGGSAVSSKTVYYGNTYGSLPTPSRTNYTFNGWYTASSGGSLVIASTTMNTAADHTLYAHWTRNTTTVSFNNNGGSGNIPSKTYNIGDAYGSLPAGPTPPTGHRFVGWFTAASGGSQITTSTIVTSGAKTFYAHYTPNTYTVSFNSNGGSSVGNKTVTYGSTYGALPTPSRTNYMFNGWYTASSGGSLVTASTKYTIASNQTLYARWTRNTVTVSFNVNGGSGSIASKIYNVGDTYGTLPGGPTAPAGHSFAGWYTAASGGTKITTGSTVNGSVTILYAHYTANSYVVNFNSNGGSSVASKTITYGSNYGALPTPARIGYVFMGWYTGASGGTQVTSTTVFRSTGNVTLYAHWKAMTLTVNFNSNGGSSVSSISVTYDSTYGTLPVPTRNGYTFQGWYTAASGGTKVTASTKVTITATQTLYAHWTGNTISVGFDNNGGSGNIPSKSYKVGDSYGSLPAAPTPSVGYEFDGWYTAKSGGTKVTTTSIVSPSVTTLYAHYKPKTFTITFNSNGGSSVANKSVTYGSTYGTLPVPTRQYFTFQGWFTASSGGTKITDTTKVSITVNQTLYAQWKRITVTTKFDNNGGAGNIPSKTYNTGEAIGSLPAGPTPPVGYSFDGWYTAANGGTKVTTSTIAQSSFTTLYAHYKAKTFTIKFNSNGGSSVADKTVTFNSTFGTLASPTRTGYAFAGWFTASSGGTQVTASTKVTTAANQTLYAHWTARSYTISFDSCGGTSVSSKSVTFAGTYGTLATPTRKGYTFQGWYTAASGGTKITSATRMTNAKNHTLYAQWKGNPITVKFDNNGGYGNVPSQTYTVGNEFGSLPVGSTPPAGYQFAGWFREKSGGYKIATSSIVSPNESVLYAHYTPKSYTITFNSNGGSAVNKKTVTYGENYGPLTSPTRQYYTFQGWYTAASGGTQVTPYTKVTTASNQTLYAHWKRITVTVNFDSNGGSGQVPSSTYNVGDPFGTLPIGPTPPKGYSFAGWFREKSGGYRVANSTIAQASDTTLYAQYTPKKYTVTFNGNGSSYTNSITVTFNGTYGSLPVPTRPGYTFNGWYTAASGGSKVTAATRVTTAGNHTLYARWTAGTYTVYFNGNGVSSPSAITVTFNGTYGTLPKVTRTGYTFQGWFTAASGGTKITSATRVTRTENHTLYAQWKGNPVTISFDNNGGYGNVPSRTYTIGDPFGSLPAGSTPPAGYQFTGWFRSKSGGYRVATSTIVSTIDKTLYAQYAPKTYTVTFNSRGGSAVANKTVTYDSAYGVLPSPTRTGYIFIGWTTGESNGVKVNASTIVKTAANHTLYAQWKRNTISVSFDNNGGYGNVPNHTYVVGEQYGSLPAGPTPPAGYAFAGWFRGKSGGYRIAKSSIVLSTDTTLYAQYTPKSYKVTFNSMGGSDVVSRTVVYGSNYGSLPVPKKSKCILDGWYTATTGGTKIEATTKMTTAADHTLYARWKSAAMTVKFDSNGGNGNVPSKTYYIGETYGSLPAGPTGPAKYVFDGWYTAKTGGTKVTENTLVLAANTTLYAHYKFNSNAFFNANPRYKATSGIQVPYNSAIEAAKNVTMDQYMDIFRRRSPKYNTKGLSDSDYIDDVRNRALVLVGGAALAQYSFASDAGHLLSNYFLGDGSRYDYSAANYVFDYSSGTEAYNKVANDLMDSMERYLAKDQSITFTDKDSASNPISFGPAVWTDLTGWNNFLAVKSGSTGVSGTCTFDGSVYRMDLYFYVQDYYDFYYEDGDWNSQADYEFISVHIDELAYLVPFGMATPFESCAVLHTRIAWYPGQEANIVTPFTPLSPDSTLAEIVQY